MVGWIQHKKGRGRNRPQTEVLAGMEVLALPLFVSDGADRKKLERRIQKLEQTLRRAEICRIIVPDNFPCRDRFTLVHPVNPIFLYRGVADLLALEVLRRKGIPPSGARAALAGPRLCPELCGTAARLCSTVRELRIDVPGEEGEDFARYLQYEFGVPVVPRRLTADAVIAFGETGESADLCLWGEPGIRLGAEGMELQEEIEQPVLELLWEQGRVKREKLQVINLP